jgi:hypothetical protein
MFVPVALLSRAKASPRLRGLLHAGLAGAIVAFGISRGVLWIASGPLVWVVLAGMDDLAMGRSGRSGAGPGPALPEDARSIWSIFDRIAVGAVVGLALLAVLRRLA